VWPARRVGRASEVEQVDTFGLVEPERTGDGVEDAVGHACEVALLQPGVVVGGHTREHRDLLTTQAGHPAVAAVDGQAGLFGGDLGPAGDKEVADLGALGAHVLHGTTGSEHEGGSVRTRKDVTSRARPPRGCLVV
jgi:hypothetical protein